MKQTILVTGGAGFVGSHLIESLLSDKNKVTSLDNYFTGKKENHIDGANYIKGHTKNISTLVKEKPAIIFHLGEYSRVEKSLDEPDVVWSFNKEGTFRVLEYARKNKCKLIYAGSSTKFGDGGLGRNQSPYAWTKASNTELIKNYGNWYDLDYAITYFYNVYGQREICTGDYATIIGIFKEKYKLGKPLTVVEPGNQRRNFTHIDDIIKGLILIGEKGYGDNYGLGNQKSYTILEIANLFDSKIKMIPARKGNRMDSEIDTTKVENEFNWKAEKSLDDYINNLKN